MALHESKDVIFLRQLNTQAARIEKDIRRHFTMIERLNALLKSNRELAKCYLTHVKEPE